MGDQPPFLPPGTKFGINPLTSGAKPSEVERDIYVHWLDIRFKYEQKRLNTYTLAYILSVIIGTLIYILQRGVNI